MIRLDRRRRSRRIVMPDRVTGRPTADISGFRRTRRWPTSSVERGAEELTANLGRVFQAVIEELDRRATSSTSPATRSRAGSTATTRRIAAGLAMQDAIGHHAGWHRGPAGTEGRGSCRRGGSPIIVGDPDPTYRRGRAIDHLAEAEHIEKSIVLDACRWWSSATCSNGRIRRDGRDWRRASLEVDVLDGRGRRATGAR